MSVRRGCAPGRARRGRVSCSARGFVQADAHEAESRHAHHGDARLARHDKNRAMVGAHPQVALEAQVETFHGLVHALRVAQHDGRAPGSAAGGGDLETVVRVLAFEIRQQRFQRGVTRLEALEAIARHLQRELVGEPIQERERYVLWERCSQDVDIRFESLRGGSQQARVIIRCGLRAYTARRDRVPVSFVSLVMPGVRNPDRLFEPGSPLGWGQVPESTELVVRWWRFGCYSCDFSGDCHGLEVIYQNLFGEIIL